MSSIKPGSFDSGSLDTGTDVDDLADWGEKDEIKKAEQEVRNAEERLRQAKKLEKLAERDETDAEEQAEVIRKKWNSDVPAELDAGMYGEKKKTTGEKVKNVATDVGVIGLAATVGGVGWMKRTVHEKTSGFLKAMEDWGDKKIDKAIPFKKYIPEVILKLLLLGKARKNVAERRVEEKKAADASAKKIKTESDKAIKAAEALKKKGEGNEKKEETTERKRQETEAKNFDKTLISFMTPLEDYNYKNGDDDVKKTLLKTVEADLPAREQKKKDRERETLLIAHMTPDEQFVYKKEIPAENPSETPEEKTARQIETQKIIAEKAALKQQVESELEARTHIAEKNKGGKKGKKGGDNGGGGKGGKGGKGKWKS